MGADKFEICTPHGNVILNLQCIEYKSPLHTMYLEVECDWEVTSI